MLQRHPIALHAVEGPQHLDAVRFQANLDRLGNRRIVVDHQNARGTGGRRFGGGGRRLPVVRRLQLEQLADQGLELVPRLQPLPHIVRAQALAALHRGLVGPARQNDHGDRRQPLVMGQLFTQVQARHRRHAHVQDQQVRRLPADRVVRLHAVQSRAGRKPQLLAANRQGLRQSPIVVGDEYGFRFHGVYLTGFTLLQRPLSGVDCLRSTGVWPRRARLRPGRCRATYTRRASSGPTRWGPFESTGRATPGNDTWFFRRSCRSR